MSSKYGIRRFDVVEYLTDEATIQAYLNEMLQEGTPAEFVKALGDVAKARGMNDLAEKTGIARTSLYKTLSSEKPRFDTIMKIVNGLGLQMTFAPLVDETKDNTNSMNNVNDADEADSETESKASESIEPMAG